MKKRGQITIFLIAAIIILSIILLFVYISSQKIPVTTPTFSTEAIEKHISDCLYSTLEQASPEYNRNLIPSSPYSQPDIYYAVYSSNIRNYINYNIKNCIDFSLFQGYIIIEGPLDSKIDIIWDYNAIGDPYIKKIFATLNYPLTIKKGDKEQKISIFEAEYNVI